MQGGCHCGALRYEIEDKPVLKAQCHCRSCQTFTGGAANLFMAFPPDALRYMQGTPQTYRKPGKEAVATREFCATCGTQIASRRDGLDLVMVKVGTLDDPAQFGVAKMAFFTEEQQAFHQIPAATMAFPTLPDMPKAG